METWRPDYHMGQLWVLKSLGLRGALLGNQSESEAQRGELLGGKGGAIRGCDTA